MRRVVRLVLAALAGLPLVTGTALAQTAYCDRLRAELANLPQRGSSQAYAALQAQRAEIARLSSYYRQIGCERGNFLFFGQPGPQCQAIYNRIQSLQANAERLAWQAAPGGGFELVERRRQLEAAIHQFCTAPDEPMFPEDESPHETPGPGGGRLVCVKSCDGSFFPLSTMPRAGADADDLCQALCPGADTFAYRMPAGDADIGSAVSVREGRSYTGLVNAFRFRKRFDPACSCRKPGQSWAEALRTAETMIERNPADISVTAELSERLSKPKPPVTPRPAPKPPRPSRSPTDG
jgi:hypothetical protein